MSQYVSLARNEICRLLSRSRRFADSVRSRGGRLHRSEIDSLDRVEASVASAPELPRYAICREDAEQLSALSSQLDTFSLRGTLLDLPHAYLLFSWLALALLLIDRPAVLPAFVLAPFWAWLVLICVLLAPLTDLGMGLWIWCLTAGGFAIALAIIQAWHVQCISFKHGIAACVWLYLGYSTNVVGWLDTFSAGDWLPTSV